MEGQQNTLILLCEDSLEGIFTGVYEAYALRRPLSEIRLQAGEETTYRLFSEYRHVAPDAGKTEKVVRTLQRRFGMKDYEILCLALSSGDEDKAQAIFGTVAWGLKNGCRGRILSHLTNPDVHRVMEMSRYARNEMHHLQGFLRFQEIEGGILYAAIAPQNHVLPFLAEHFSDRFPMENFLIHDERRDMYAVHPAGKAWFLVAGDLGRGADAGGKSACGEDVGDADVVSAGACGVSSARVDVAGESACGEDTARENVAGAALTAEEEYYQELFCCFCHKISIKERKNLNLQRNLLPLHFRKYMVEFAEK